METRYRYLSLDSDHDVSADTLEVSLSPLPWDVDVARATASPVAAPAEAAGLRAPGTGLTRYWWRVLIGPGETLVPTRTGRARLYGQFTDNPEILEPVWTITV